jgi:glycosyltransferase involved in cell wall biosynthesis
MKIAQIAPLYESVPPKLYGGTERIVSYLTEELVAANHDITLFASADSVTRARLVPASKTALRLSASPIVDSVAHYIRLLELVFREADQFDILHFHIDYLHYPWTVIACRQGAVPEIIEDGKTGFIVDSQDDAVAAVDRLALIDRVLCRREFERRFTARRMTADYIRIYEELWSGGERGKKVTPFSQAA